jgi:hypothetical protein
MKPEEKRIAIALACGWKKQEPDSCFFDDPTESFQVYLEGLPDYANNLNAMHEAEKVLLNSDQQNRYQAEISEICWSDEERRNNQVVFNQLTASATQRAEAFLRTLNLWTE